MWAGVFPPKAHMAHIFPREVPVPPGTVICTCYIPEHFWCLNTIIEYINLYLSTISRLLVMSVISSGTPNNIRGSELTTSQNLVKKLMLSFKNDGSFMCFKASVIDPLEDVPVNDPEHDVAVNDIPDMEDVSESSPAGSKFFFV